MAAVDRDVYGPPMARATQRHLRRVRPSTPQLSIVNAGHLP